MSEFLSNESVLPRPLFALIIGIDYRNRPQLKLNAAVKDACAIREFVQTSLGVGDKQLLYLEDEKATRAAILEAFQQLPCMPGMQRGDAILIYFAGHGDKIKLSSPTEKSVESIVPYDCDWEKVYPIPDRTIGTLLGHIYGEQGDNITVIFDCCFSGGVNRKPGYRERAVRFGEANVLPYEVDRSLLLRLSSRDLTLGPFTHVFLAACSEQEKAGEDDEGGYFTKSLLDVLRSRPIRELTYADTVHYMQMKKLTIGECTQNPQCRGENCLRLIFDGDSPLQMWYRVKRANKQEYILLAGAVHGVTISSTFKIYTKRDTSDDIFLLATMPVAQVRSVDSTFVMEGDAVQGLATLDADETFALQETVGKYTPPSLYIDEESNGPVTQALAVLRQQQKSFYFDSKAIESDATFKVISREGQLSFYHVDNGSGNCFAAYGLTKLPHVLPATLDHAQRLLTKAAQFFYYLNLDNKPPPVNIELGEILEPQDWDDPTLDRNLFVSGKVVIPVDALLKMKVYGLRIANRTNYGLYVSLFHFHGRRLDITRFYGPGCRGNFKTDPCLPPRGELTLGYGPQNMNPLNFSLPDDQNIDISYLKFIFTTKPANLWNISSLTPFSDGWTALEGVHQDDGTRAVMPAWTPKLPDLWGTTLIPVIVKRAGSI